MSTFCTYYDEKKCSSCRLITIPYTDQIQKKEEKLSSLLGISPLKSVTSKEVGFRAKAKMVVSGTYDHPVIGLADQEILDCPIHHAELNHLIKKIKSFITLAKLDPYDIASQKGELKNLILFYSPLSDRFYLRFVLRSQEAETRIKKHLPSLLGSESRLQVISLNLQPIPHAILEGSQEIYLTQELKLDFMMSNFHFKLSPQGFVQTNFEVAEILYKTASEWIRDLKINLFIELYSGQGFFSFFAASSFKIGLGIEINPEAVRAANEFAQKNNLHHLKFISNQADSLNEKADLILVNPPRAGLKETAEILMKLKPKYLIYSSCDPQTLSQDHQKLEVHYKLIKAQIFDMFPHTEHFETLCLYRLQ